MLNDPGKTKPLMKSGTEEKGGYLYSGKVY